MNELKPCPFCGRSAKEHVAFSSGITPKVGVYVECESCGASTATFWNGDQQQKAIDEWNQRYEESDRKKLIELADELDRVQRTLVTGAYMEPMEAAVRIRKALGMVE